MIINVFVHDLIEWKIRDYFVCNFDKSKHIPLILSPSCWYKVSSESETTFWLLIGSDWTGKTSEIDGYCCNSGFNPTGIEGLGIDDGGGKITIFLSIHLLHRNKISFTLWRRDRNVWCRRCSKPINQIQ